MPQLPSGMHIAVDTMPLAELLDNWTEDSPRQQLLSLKTVDDLYALTRILELVPAQTGELPLSLAAGSAAPPQEMVVKDTGYRLNEYPDGLDTWSPEDRAAFQVYVQTRVRGFLAAQLETTKKTLDELVKKFLKDLGDAWRQAGVHPDQEPGGNDWPDNPNIDVFDRIVALVQCRDALCRPGAPEATRSPAVDRLQGVLAMAAGKLAWFPKPIQSTASTAVLAHALRRAVEPNAFPADKRAWWEAQMSIECDNLFNDAALEDFLMHHAPKAYGVVRLSAAQAGAQNLSDGVSHDA